MAQLLILQKISAAGGDVIVPVITSANSANNAENSTLAHSLTANESVTWSIVGGVDQARFEISGSTLRWASNGTKDYETPNDSNTNNTYIVDVRATDTANNTADQTITITVTDVGEGMADFTVNNRSELDAAMDLCTGGEVIQLNDGTYGEYTNTHEFASYVTLRAANVGMAHFNGGFALNSTLTMNIIFDGLKFNGVGMSGSPISNFKFNNCEVYGWGFYVTDGQNWEYTDGIIRDSVQDLVQIANDSHTFTLADNMIYGVNNGLGSGDWHPDGVQIFSSSGAAGMPHNFTISGNWVYDDNSDNGADYMQGIFLHPATGDWEDIVIEQNMVAVASPNALFLHAGTSSTSNVIIRDNAILYNGNLELHGDCSGVTLDGNIYDTLTVAGSPAATGYTVVDDFNYNTSGVGDHDIDAIFEDPSEGESWENFIPKTGGLTDFGSHYGPQDRLTALMA